jgi:hypothetical protein
MSSDNRISEKSPAYQFLIELNFLLFFTKPNFNHIIEFLSASIQKGYKGTVTDIVDLSLSSCHRTTFGKFLSQGKWNPRFMWNAIKKYVINLVFEMSKDSDNPVFVIFDDTIAEKTKPSSRAEKPIEATGFHQSHLKNKQVFGHQFLCVMLSCSQKSFIYHIERYVQGAKSKIERVCEIVDSLPVPKGEAYGLCDSWFTSEKVINAHFKNGYNLIGALKTNRIIYPQGIRIQIKNFAQYIEKSDVCLVTVNSSKYWVYRYEGSLNGIENAVVLFCWSKNSFKNPKALRAFLCTNPELDSQTILEYYSNRWPVEVFFRETKNNLGLNTYQVRSAESIDKLLALISLTHLFCSTQSQEYSFAEGLKNTRNRVKKEHITWIYQKAKNDVPLDEIFELMKVA